MSYRVCDDDIKTGNSSLYCSLYYASIELDGVYRHRRPAMQAVRKVLIERYPVKYVHIIRDINNNPDITNNELLDVLDAVIKQLNIELTRQ